MTATPTTAIARRGPALAPTPVAGRADLSSALPEAQPKNDCCVTVFGFAPDDVSAVLDLFERIGVVARRHVEPGANWIHLQYAVRAAAAAAVSKHRGVLLPRCMLGVVYCTDDVFLGKAVAEPTESVLGTPVPHRAASVQPRLLNTASAIVTPSAAAGSATPQKTAPSYVALAREYLLGW